MKRTLWRRKDKGSTKILKVIGTLAAIGAVTLLVQELPPLRRYLRMKRM